MKTNKTKITYFGGGDTPAPIEPTPPPPPPSKTAEELRTRKPDVDESKKTVGESLRIKRGTTGVSGGGPTGLGI